MVHAVALPLMVWDPIRTRGVRSCMEAEGVGADKSPEISEPLFILSSVNMGSGNQCKVYRVYGWGLRVDQVTKRRPRGPWNQRTAKPRKNNRDSN